MLPVALRCGCCRCQPIKFDIPALDSFSCLEMKRTVSITVDLPHERFLPLMGFCADIFNQHVDWALKEQTWNKNKAHKALYADLRLQYPDVPSALLQTIRDNAMEAVKATKFNRTPRKKPTSGLRYDKRTMTLRGYQLTLSCIGKRENLS